MNLSTMRGLLDGKLLGNYVVKRHGKTIDTLPKAKRLGPPNTTKIIRTRIENLKVHAKRLFGNENVWVEMHRGIPIEVEPLDETPLENLGLNTCNHDIPINSKEIPSIDEPEPQPQPLPNCLSLDVRGPGPPIKPHSPDSFRMKEVDRLTINTPPSPHVDLTTLRITKKCFHGVDISNWEMFDDVWGLEFKEVSPIGKELSLFDRLNEAERGRIPEAHRLESILQQQISQHMAPFHHDGMLYLMRRSLEVLRKFHWMILGGRSNQLSHVSSPLLSKPEAK
ncbi:hypothetical protein Tco_0157864 [Tanacetum coccineum]